MLRTKWFKLWSDKASLKRSFRQNFLGHQGPRRRLDVPDKALCKEPFCVVINRERPGCPVIWVEAEHLGAHLLSLGRTLPSDTTLLLTKNDSEIITVQVKIITGSLVIPEDLFPNNYRYRLEIRINFHYRYRLGVRSHPFISIDSQLPS